ncbi:MAG: hypothetical protein K0R38_4067 [Polyangiaceae bacterium]|nr:hypothetical protein [Polyangiaceae bacterium]
MNKRMQSLSEFFSNSIYESPLIPLAAATYSGSSEPHARSVPPALLAAQSTVLYAPSESVSVVSSQVMN